jgi:predicted Zn-dependent protease with MMP-like domain
MDRKKLDALLDKAYEALDAGDLPGARAALARARKLAPEDRDVIVLQVDLALEKAGDGEEMDRALEPLDSAVERKPEDPALAATLASYLIDLFEDYFDARPLLELAASALEVQVDGEPGDEGASRDLLVGVLLLLAEARGAMREPRAALDAARRAVEVAPDSPEVRVALADARFDLCDLRGARDEVRQALELDPKCADAHWALGRIETASRDMAAADAAFEKAVRLDPERFFRPTRVTETELVALVEEGLAELPEAVRDFMKNVAITVEDVPAMERLTDQDPPLSPGILGLFEGTPPVHEATDGPAVLPRQITLFRRNIEIESSDRDELRDLALSTLVHEIGHYLGLDEDDLDKRGLS